jgi:hypothetical protein
MRFLVLLVGVAALFGNATPVLVSPAIAGDADACVKGTGDEKIAACTRSINSGLWKGPNLAWAYTNRGHRVPRQGRPKGHRGLRQAVGSTKFADAITAAATRRATGVTGQGHRGLRPGPKPQPELC